MDIFEAEMARRFVVAVEKIANALDRKTEPTISKMEQVDEPQTERIKTLDYCDICNHKGCDNCIANNLDDYCVPSGYAPKDTPQTDCEDVWRAGYKTGYDKGYKDAQKVKDSQDLVKDLVKAFGEDGTWLERQGVYTLTLAEAKQRAVDIIESIIERKEGE